MTLVERLERARSGGCTGLFFYSPAGEEENPFRYTLAPRPGFVKHEFFAGYVESVTTFAKRIVNERALAERA